MRVLLRMLQQVWDNREDATGQMLTVVWGLGCGHRGLCYTILSLLLFLFGSYYGKVISLILLNETYLCSPPCSLSLEE